MNDNLEYRQRVLTLLTANIAVWAGLGACSFFIYRLTTYVPNSQVSQLGVAFIVLLGVVLAIGSGGYCTTIYRRIGADESLGQFVRNVVTREKTLDMYVPVSPYDASGMSQFAIRDGDVPPEMLMAEHGIQISEKDRQSPLLQRVQRLLEGEANVFIDSALTKYAAAEDKDPSEFALLTTKAGLFADGKVADRFNGKVLASIPDGKILWQMKEDPVHDRLRFVKKTPFPPIVLPAIPSHVVTDLADAKALYDTYRLVVGVDAFGTDIELNLAKTPHGLVIGGSGSGKSVFNRGLMEHMRSQGWQIILVDGKRSDFVSMVNVPNVLAVGKSPEDWLRLTQYVLAQTTARYNRAMERQRKGLVPAFDQPPMLFLLDEFGSVVRDVQDRFGKAGHDALFSALKSIAAKARQAKIHMIIATQEIYAETLPGSLKSNLSYIISLGVPGTTTLRDGFAKELAEEAKRIGQSIRKNDKGRGIIQVEPEGQAATIVEFQTYYGYSPGDPDGIPRNNPKVAQAWTEYKSKVSDKIPLLYPRVWWDEPTPDDVAAIETPEELASYPMKVIQARDGSILPEFRKLDRNADEYIGNTVSDSAEEVVGFEEDLT